MLSKPAAAISGVTNIEGIVVMHAFDMFAGRDKGVLNAILLNKTFPMNNATYSGEVYNFAMSLGFVILFVLNVFFSG